MTCWRAHGITSRKNFSERRLTQIAGSFSKPRSEEHTSELQSQSNLVCRLLLEKKKESDRPGDSPELEIFPDLIHYHYRTHLLSLLRPRAQVGERRDGRVHHEAPPRKIAQCRF